MSRWLYLLVALLVAPGAWAQCTGAGGVPFACVAGTTPTGTDLVLGGSATAKNTVKWTWNQVLNSNTLSVSFRNLTTSQLLSATTVVVTGSLLVTAATVNFSNGLGGSPPVFTEGASFSAPVLLAHYIVSTLPTCDIFVKGGFAYVTDALSPTYNGVLTGGSNTIVPVFCNGSAWSSH